MFIEEAADINGDGEVNVTDIVLVVNIIMSAQSTNARCIGNFALTDSDRLTLTEADGQRFGLCLENAGRYVASQLEVRVSDGETIDGISLNGERSGRHLLTYAKTGKNTYKVVVYSLDNSSFDGHEGELLSIRVAGNGSVSIENIVFVTIGNVEKHFAPLGSSTTGIDNSELRTQSSESIFDLQGRRVANTVKKGVYIINGKKHFVR